MSSQQPEPLEVQTVEDLTVVKFHRKRLDAANVESYAKPLLRLVASGRHQLQLDLEQVEYLGSLWVGLFVTLHKKVRAEGGHLTLCNLVDNVYELFEVTHLHQKLDVRRKEAKG